MLRVMDDRWAVVDVETSGFDSASCRVLSVAALAVDGDGVVRSSVASLLDAGVDPGPVEVHGLTVRKLAGQPRFIDVAPSLSAVLADRILVAHNVEFDFGFLVAEADRCGTQLPIAQVMCTVDLASRLSLGLANLKLTTLAHHFGVAQARPHDAFDDAQVLADVLGHLLVRARELGVALPIRSVRRTSTCAA